MTPLAHARVETPVKKCGLLNRRSLTPLLRQFSGATPNLIADSSPSTLDGGPSVTSGLAVPFQFPAREHSSSERNSLSATSHQSVAADLSRGATLLALSHLNSSLVL